MPAVLSTSSNDFFFFFFFFFFFLRLASLLVLKSVTTNDNFSFGSTASTNSGIGNISLSLKYLAYFVTLSLSWSEGDFFFFVTATTRRLALLVASVLVEWYWPMKVISLPASMRVLCQ